MPIYLFSNPSDENEIIEIVMSVNDSHEYIKDGIKWNREYTVPNAAIDTKWDANNPQDFVEKSARKHGTLGDIMDKSKELSEKREKDRGVDIVKEDMYKRYAKIRKGKMHPNQRKEKLDKILKTPIDLKIK